MFNRSTGDVLHAKKKHGARCQKIASVAAHLKRPVRQFRLVKRNGEWKEKKSEKEEEEFEMSPAQARVNYACIAEQRSDQNSMVSRV